MKSSYKFVLFVAAVLTVILFLVYPKIDKYYEKYATEREENWIYKTYKDSIWTFPFTSYRCSRIVQFKLNQFKKKISFNCIVTADSGFTLDGGAGTLNIELIDNTAFMIEKISLTEKINMKDKNDQLVSYVYRGEYPPEASYIDRLKREEISYGIAVQQFIKVKNISVSNSLTFLPVASHLLSDEKKGLITKKSGSHSKESRSDFDQEMDRWTEKASKIKIGMTYRDMVAVAGEPRLSSEGSFDERVIQGYDDQKFNYGRKWIFFKNELVARIK